MLQLRALIWLAGEVGQVVSCNLRQQPLQHKGIHWWT